MEKDAFIGLRAYTAEKELIDANAKSAGVSTSKFLLDCAMRQIAENAAARAGLPSPSETFAQDSARFRWFCGNAASPDHWPACDHVLAGMGPEFKNIDFRSALFHELYVRRPEIAVAAFALSEKQKEAADVLVESAFAELFDSEPEAKFDAPSVDDTAKLLLAENAGWQAVVDAHQTTNALVANVFGEAERAGVAGRRSHLRRILRAWRERGIPWPEIVLDRHGTPRLVDNVRIEFSPENGRLAPRLVASDAPSESDARRSTPDPVTGQRAPITPYGSARVGASAGEAMTRAFLQRVGGKIAGE